LIGGVLMAGKMQRAIKVRNLFYTYSNTGQTVLKGISLRISKGEIIALLGSNGSGKSTLFYCIDGLFKPQAGQIFVNGTELFNGNQKAELVARKKVSMIFQHFGLIGRSSVFENVLIGRLGSTSTLRSCIRAFPEEDIKLVEKNLQKVKMLPYSDEKACNLSGGEMQRVAIARALTQQPEIILADEPTASLDPKFADNVMRLLKSLCKQESITLFYSTHSLPISKKYGERTIAISEGKISFEGNSEKIDRNAVNAIYDGQEERHYL